MVCPEITNKDLKPWLVSSLRSTDTATCGLMVHLNYYQQTIVCYTVEFIKLNTEHIWEMKANACYTVYLYAQITVWIFFTMFSINLILHYVLTLGKPYFREKKALALHTEQFRFSPCHLHKWLGKKNSAWNLELYCQGYDKLPVWFNIGQLHTFLARKPTPPSTPQS